jgi:molybdenum cofactor cytidylyltransferase
MAVVAIVPAAGRSRRMGRAKLLLPFDDTTVLGAVIRALGAGGVSRTIVVRAAMDRDIQRWADEHEVETVANVAPERSMLHSVLEGLQALGGAESLGRFGTTVLICPGDLPSIQPSSVAALIATLEQGALLAVPAHGGRRGHPLAIAPSLLTEIPKLDPRVGLRQLLEREPEAVTRVRVDDPGVLRDVDTPEDYRRLIAAADGLDESERA